MSISNVKKIKSFFRRTKKSIIYFVKNCPYFSLIILSILSVILMHCSEWFALLFFVPLVIFIKYSFEKLKMFDSERKQIEKVLKNEILELQKDVSDLSYILENMKKDEKDPFNSERKEIIEEINENLESRIEKFNIIIKLYDN